MAETEVVAGRYEHARRLGEADHTRVIDGIRRVGANRALGVFDIFIDVFIDVFVEKRLRRGCRALRTADGCIV